MTHSFISQTLSYTDNGTPLRSCWCYVGGEVAAGCDQGRFPSRDSLPNGLEMWEGYRVKGVMHVGLGRSMKGLMNRFAWAGWRAGIAICGLVR